MKFTEKGHVLVDVGGDVVDGVIQLKVRVEDTGIGIPAEKLQNVFEKFAQVDGSSTRRHEGTGLGLAIAARLVDLMGGKIGVESEIGRGSVFWFAVPLPAHQQAARDEIVPVDVTGARVLVIDDNPVNREILLEQLKSWTSTARPPKAAPSAWPSSTAPASSAPRWIASSSTTRCPA
ncbi:hypothetical protein AJ88_46045 [Mesorhizobium amorphae CCBAU 01583]|nr:hypothetical protein AJ88_46045 [Mesorhizobium amorphae CCBAU 01583]